MDFKRENFSSGAPLEEKVGYSRVVKVGPLVHVGGTTSVQSDGSVFGVDDGYAQTKFILEKIEDNLNKAGAGLKDVTKVKMYAVDMGRSSEYIKAYSEFFKEIKPLFTLVGIKELNRETQLLEIEVDAFINA
ncbi:Rid family hydrolase [Halanaerobium hydrogeniformans]|uniref:Endoribonuclease L-PSP n=1 Tax=Halanaerobium hydrogeniformans TaxID=656519 RepID=E4RP09_HALHG|nr:Rid family hydrolase [Halanaerobium hydrogeniformans]ADQ13699.1 Endoribonuclease L-PSP [Halanaerobium hydrogeniformans]